MSTPAKSKQKRRIRSWIPYAHGAIWLVCAVVVTALYLKHAPTPASSSVYRSVPPGELADDAATLTPKATHEGLRYHAIVVGISNYKNFGADGWDKLRTARHDAEAVADVLEEQYGFSVKRLFDRDATRSAVISALDDLTSLTARDAVMVYFAGHGFYEDQLSEGYWIPADARRMADGKYAKADWIWNSTITKMIAAARAKHVLIVADSCFSGSMFRGGYGKTLENDFQWYMRAVDKPSRYLITSGDLEPVLDDGGDHSIFAQEFLNYLGYPDKAVFSASDVALALREKVSTLTGQLVRMGPLAVSTHAGGEFVFVTEGTEVDWDQVSQADVEPGVVRGTREGDGAGYMPDRAMQDALQMAQRGAVKSAQQVASTISKQEVNDIVAQAVSAHLDVQKKSAARQELQSLIAKLEEQKQVAQNQEDHYAGYARPRVLACLGPEGRGLSIQDASLVTLAQLSLQAQFGSLGGVHVVEREALEDILLEMNLGSSSLADERARMEVSKLLPASFLLLGDLVPSGDEVAMFLRLVDTETSRIITSVSGTIGEGHSASEVTKKLAGELYAKMQEHRPLAARIRAEQGDLLVAGMGAFHGAEADQSYRIVRHVSMGDDLTDDVKKEEVGRASIKTLGDFQSVFSPSWPDGKRPNDLSSCWIEELL